MKMVKFNPFDLKMPLIALFIAILLMALFIAMPFGIPYSYLLISVISLLITGILAGYHKNYKMYLPYLIGIVLIWIVLTVLPLNITNLSGNDQIIMGGVISFFGVVFGEYLNQKILKI